MSTNIHTIPEMVNFWAETSPDSEVFTFVNREGTYAVYTPPEIRTLASRFASRLRRYGFTDGDVIANGLPNSPERLITDLGSILAGCVPVNCQILQLDGADFWNTAKLAACRGVVISNRADDIALKLFSSHLPQNCPASGCLNVTVPEVSTLQKLIIVSRNPGDKDNSLLESLRSSDEEEYFRLPSPQDLAVLFATSGSSGFCKLVPRTHEEVLRCGRAFQASKSERYFSDRPFGWMGGFPFDYLAHCSARVLQDMYNDDQVETARDLWAIISREKCSGAAILPLDIMKLVKEFKDARPDFKLSVIVTGGQPLKQSLTAALGLLTDALVVSYSSTEASIACIGVVSSPTQFQDFYSGRPVKSIGVEIQIADEAGNPLEAGEEGEILIKSPIVMKSYYRQPVTPQIFTRGDWFRSGDRGYLDSAGNLYCFGRSGDVVSKGSVLIYSSWPESIISKCKDVVDVAVVGLPNDSGGEKLCACVIPTPDSTLTENSLLEFYHSSLVKSSSRDDFAPSLEAVLFFKKFPQTSSGKLNKAELKATVKQLLNQ